MSFKRLGSSLSNKLLFRKCSCSKWKTMHCIKAFISSDSDQSPTEKIIPIQNEKLQTKIQSSDLDSRTLEQTSKPLNSSSHIPVLKNEVLKYLDPKPGMVFVDMTFGAGGHTKTLLNQENDVVIYALDRDPIAFNHAKQLNSEYKQVIPMLGKFSEVDSLLMSEGLYPGDIDGFLFDVGASSMQFDSKVRGFGVSRNAPLDMRMDGNRCPDQPSASDVVNVLDEKGLYDILKKYGEEKKARKIARAIIDSRNSFGFLKTTKELVKVVESVYDSTHFQDKLRRHASPATKTFQALRIFINDELNELHNGLILANKFLKPSGICAVISFHSLEDRIAKRHFNGIDIDDRVDKSLGDKLRNQNKLYDEKDMKKLLEKMWSPVSKKIILPTQEEIKINPRARSAKLRVARKLEQ